ncbi:MULTISPECIES: DMT family transporter [unclassified Clostridioides]|uniref:DMT family transporter n=1 Tax=unclassified Clostridioides TaxID=2635829 RepID=UPI001D11A1BD|nr:EamA family transporter [Clostridioides sp. ZZV14-6150]MCC0660817.1 EamA family transporter [Clostridioides sp. ZZV14-6154]MCC0721421.1 EamA family transporter [Clostridioides sp. ZZV14-6104]MCC0725613.1 EamA family transporter [Clostridioides sp. ZZV14-6045]MCC0729711.1 EamA family transporter [Clostridioides sp. ZZV14-6048]MCC0734358.1 EamA family transporter [Clostridioides sp. ZZV14-6009]MCC0738002.1 EamA family transporter [Clostridioides sp. ZZV14-5902]MCC0741969.1 EamA family trans
MKKGYILIGCAGSLFATTGLFSSNLIARGLTVEQITFTRAFIGFLVISIYSVLKKPEVFKTSKKVIGLSMLSGIICQVAFNVCYFKAISSVGISIAAVLLYTSPLFVALFSNIVYKENINKMKRLSILLCFIGAIVAVLGGRFEFAEINVFGFLLGLGASLTYACMPIINKGALKECSSFTIIIYGFLFGSIFITPIAKPWLIISHVTDISTLILIIGIGVFPAALAYICYVGGIEMGIELSVAGVVSSIELVISVLIGWFILGEAFSFIKLIGVLIMIVSALVATKAPTKMPTNKSKKNYRSECSIMNECSTVNK